MKELLEWTQFAANVATCLGIMGIVVAYRQFRAGAIAQKQTMAITAWNEYLKLALAHPQLSRPTNGFWKNGTDSPEFSQYRWFVAMMLFAGEQALEAHNGDSAWEEVVEAQLRYHRGFLKSQFFDPNVYSPPVRRLAIQVRDEPVAEEHLAALPDEFQSPTR